MKSLERAYRLATITQRIGFTLWQLQALEGAAAHYFVTVAQASKAMGLEAGFALLDKAKAKTFGATIAQMTRAGVVTPEIGSRFSRLLAERNWLVHNSRGESSNAVNCDGAAEMLITRLSVVDNETIHLLGVLSSLAEQHVMRLGVTSQQIEQETKALLKQWHTGDAI